MNLVIILSAVTGGILYHLFKRKRWVSSLLFGFGLFFFGMFLFGKPFHYEYSRETAPEVFLLIDASLSMPTNEIARIAGEIESKNIYYFADYFGDDTNGLNLQYSAVYDTVYSFTRDINEGDHVIVYSDFNDNDSYLEPKPNNKVISLLPEGNPADEVSVYEIRSDDYLQSRERSEIEVIVYSVTNRNADLTVKSGTADIYSGSIDLLSGTNSVRFKHRFSTEGYRLLSAEIESGSDGYSTNNSAMRLIRVIPSYYRLKVAAGRPSEEFAFLRRFIDSIQWIDADFTVLNTSTNRLTLGTLSGYSGVILMDIEPKQISDPEQLLKIEGGLLYLPGLTDPDKSLTLIEMFTNISALSAEGEKKFLYNSHELYVDTRFKNSDMLIEVSDRIRLFLGWNTHRWDFMRLSLGIDTGYYDEFWKNQLIFLINADQSLIELERLNYVYGEKLPLDTDSTGRIRFTTNGQLVEIYVGNHTAELARLSPDSQAASLMNTNMKTISEIENTKVWLDSIRGDQRYHTVETITVDFKRNLVVFILFILSLILFWFSSDWEEIKR